MRIGQWKRKQFAYNPNKPKILAFRPDTRPHALTCRCTACVVYLKLIQTLNPMRYEALTEESEPFIRRQSEQSKRFAVERYQRENRQKASIKWRG